MTKIKIGVIGCGTIGSVVAEKIVKDYNETAELFAISDVNADSTKALITKIGSLTTQILDVDTLIKNVDIVVEAAYAESVPSIVSAVIKQGKKILVMSVGGLYNNENLFDEAKKTGAVIYIPTGAIAGLDCIKAANKADLETVKLITRKPPQGLKGAPYIVKNNINLDSITEETVIFEGYAKDAVTAFPKNINVAAALSFAGLGFEKTQVIIMTSPNYTKNSHEIIATGSFGTLTTKTENVPSPNNPKTSYLAVLSAVASLDNILSNVRVGT